VQPLGYDCRHCCTRTATWALAQIIITCYHHTLSQAVKADLQRVDLELKATGDALAKGIAENKGSIGALEETVSEGRMGTVASAQHS
jgi:hypothetical protein